ncbi:MAG: LysE family translocator [Meiothermus sp.]|nr:LysE family translocator [Meiothermus sp.]
MEFQTWLLYFAVAFVNIVTPGAAVLLAITTGLQYGPRGALFTTLGNITGLAVLASLSALGLGAVVLASEVMFTGIKWAGALYLIYLGLSLALSRRNTFAEDRHAAAGKTPAQLFLQAFTLAVGNPKPIAFFTAVFPQFIEPAAPLPPQFALMTLTFVSISFCSLMAYSSLASVVKPWFRRPSRARWFNRLAGAALVGLGARLAASES